jgi:hypothetical protein
MPVAPKHSRKLGIPGTISPRTIPMAGDAFVRTQFHRPICSGGFHRSLSRFTQKVSRPSRPGSDNSPATADRHHVAGSKPRNDIFSSRVQNAARPESDDAMTDRPAIFVSATSGEFRSFRLAVKRQLERKGVLMIVSRTPMMRWADATRTPLPRVCRKAIRRSQIAGSCGLLFSCCPRVWQ